MGLDFRALLPPLFERAILDLFSARVEMATADFVTDLPTMALVYGGLGRLAPPCAALAPPLHSAWLLRLGAVLGCRAGLR